MRFVDYFYLDRQILEVPGDEVLLNSEQQKRKIEEWASVDAELVKVVYDNNVYEAAVLQVLLFYSAFFKKKLELYYT